MLYLVIALGAGAGWLCMMLCRQLIASRTMDAPQNWYLSSNYAPLFWCIFSAACFGTFHIMTSSALAEIEYIIIFLLCLCMSTVDFAIRKIPNSLLVVLICVKVVFLVLNFSMQEFTQSLLGLVVACVVFTVPSLLKMSVGAGDVKLACAVGLYLGVTGFLQAMILMAVAIGMFGLYLLIRKLGNLKTKTAMGPYLAFGFLLTLVYPII